MTKWEQLCDALSLRINADMECLRELVLQRMEIRIFAASALRCLTGV